MPPLTFMYIIHKAKKSQDSSIPLCHTPSNPQKFNNFLRKVQCCFDRKKLHFSVILLLIQYNNYM